MTIDTVLMDLIVTFRAMTISNLLTNRQRMDELALLKKNLWKKCLELSFCLTKKE